MRLFIDNLTETYFYLSGRSDALLCLFFLIFSFLTSSKMSKTSVTLIIKKPILPRVHPPATRPSYTFYKTRRFPPPSHKEFGFIGRVYLYTLNIAPSTPLVNDFAHDFAHFLTYELFIKKQGLKVDHVRVTSAVSFQRSAIIKKNDRSASFLFPRSISVTINSRHYMCGQ